MGKSCPEMSAELDEEMVEEMPLGPVSLEQHCPVDGLESGRAIEASTKGSHCDFKPQVKTRGVFMQLITNFMKDKKLILYTD